ncbi:MAG: hypothetical protein KDI90_03005 [Alphaproteobacteria bacterium]|nr:hypothetical protein [Alphaproteobacteria bacterium]MCB9974767.1 hypothetical protein [Rhodospirillales bacterium]
MRKFIFVTGFALISTISFPSYAEFESQASVPKTSGDPFNSRLWEASVRTYFGHNDNVQLTPDRSPFYSGDETKSAFFGATFNGLVIVPLSDSLTVGAALKLNTISYLDEMPPALVANNGEFRDYNMVNVDPSVFTRYSFDALGMPANVGLTYSFHQEKAKNVEAVDLESHTFTIDGKVMVRQDTQLGLVYSHSNNEFGVVFPGVPASNRDSKYNAVTLSAQHWFSGRRRSVSAGVTFANNDAEGRDWDYHGYTVNGAFRSHLCGPIYGKIDGSYSDLDYKGGFTNIVAAPGREYQKVKQVGLQLLWQFNDRITFDAYFNREHYDSNMPQFEGENTIKGLGMTFNF